MLEIGAAIEFISELDVFKGETKGKLIPSVAEGRVGLGTLFGIKLDKVSEPKEADGTGGNAEGRVEGRFEGRVEGRFEGRVEGRFEGRVEGRFEGRAEGRVDDDKEVEVKLREPLLVGSKGEEYSGRFEPGKFGAPGCKGALKPGYCIGGCKEGGNDRPGGGRSKDCWCK